MGYRHIMVSETLVPNYINLPLWFKEKYKGVVDFDRDYWASYTEYKRYGLLANFEEDVQKVLNELYTEDSPYKHLYEESIRLIFYADESDDDYPDLSYVVVTKDKIKEVNMRSLMAQITDTEFVWDKVEEQSNALD